MSLIVNPGYALRFNGVSDSVLVPVGSHNIHGKQDTERPKLPKAISSFTLETWIIPDCGGVVFEQDNVMRLTVGSPGGPAPAMFEIRLKNLASGKDNMFTISSALPVNKPNGRLAYWDGALFPNPSGPHDSYSGADARKDDASAFNDGNRELLNVTVTFNRRHLTMQINGELVASKTFDEDHELVNQSNRIFLGGRGGDYRGIIEAVHWSRGEMTSGSRAYGPLKSDSTLGLWRFEEPIEPIDIITTTPSLTASAAANSTINIGATAAQKLIDEFSGQSGLTALDFTLSPWNAAASASNQGSYQIKVYGATSSTDVNIPKVPYNIIVNPLGHNPDTGKPTTKAPERLRLMSIDSGAGTITVESIHLDFTANPTSGRRGLLMSHDAGSFVIVTGDCVVDGGNGNAFQPHGSGTQFSQRQGQVIIDEGPFGLHGMLFSLSMAVDSSSHNPFSASTTHMAKEFLIGHCGRHTLNHVESHPFIGMLPPPAHHEVDKKLDASSDVISATFPAQFADVKSIVPTDSIVSAYDNFRPLPLTRVISSSTVTNVIENGMAGIDDTQRDILAIGGADFNPQPFLLRSQNASSNDNDARNITPSDKSRIAILELPSLSDYGYAPFLQLHYNAVDRNGDLFETTATGRIVSATPTVITLQSTKAFGFDGEILDANEFYADNVVAADKALDVTATISHSANTITFDSASTGAFQLKAIAHATLMRKVRDTPKIMVTKTLPKVSTVVGSKRIIDLIYTDMRNRRLQLHAPGAVVEFTNETLLPFLEGHLEGDSSEGTVGESKLDFSLCPENYLPLHSTDKPQNTPQKIKIAQNELASRSSKFHKLSISINEDSVEELETKGEHTIHKAYFGKRRRPGVFINSGAGYVLGTRTALTVDGMDATTVFNVKENVYKADGTDLGIITAVTPTTLTFDTDFTQLTRGSGYTAGAGIATSGGTGAGLTVDITVTSGAVTGVTINAAGTGYLKNEILTIAGGTGATIQINSIGTLAAVVDNDELYSMPVVRGTGTTNQASAVHEMFDIIEHNITDTAIQMVIQPTDRRRFNQGSRLVAQTENANKVSLQYLISEGKVVSFSDDGNGNSVLLAHSVLSDIASSSVYVKGDGASDSHIVKEIMPGAPVVTMTLGGPGQGAINTKETWDPSPIARLTWNTRRSSQAVIKETGATTLTVLPLNNRATDLQSWGTYPFPSKGKVYLQLPKKSEDEPNRFANATYESKDGISFTFAAGSGVTGQGLYILGDGSEADSFAAWLSATGIGVGDIIHVDDKFGEETMCNDGTTINDRLFQTLDSVQHDYQLGTQYASTRALVEIPLFHDQIFGELVGPDNAMKLHIDCTHTAHSWNPNPVGRRFGSVGPADPEVFGPFSFTLQNHGHSKGTKITRDYESTGTHAMRVYVQDADIFPIPTAAPIQVAGLDGSLRYRRAFLSSGEWCIYTARDVADNFITIGGTAGDRWSMSKNFLRDLKVGAHISPSSGYQDMNYTGIADNPNLISAGYENRRSFYYDRSNVMTQGGNVDYGLKQYVSAVEFRAGPRSNPHLPRIKNKRPRAKVILRTPTHPTKPVTQLILDDATLFPTHPPVAGYLVRLCWKDSAGVKHHAYYNTRSNNSLTITNPTANFNPNIGDEILVEDFYANPAAPIYPLTTKEGFLNRAWAHPYAPGGLRNGDTVWMNMHYTNPHAIEGLFCKSRGTLNEAEVWTGFNGGQGSLSAAPRDSIPMENFLIGNTCIETAQNFVQHINKTIELNYEALHLVTAAPVVAYLDPYQSTEEHARVLLYDVAHDREFISFQDLWMQVQTSPATAQVGVDDVGTSGSLTNVIPESGSTIDVAAGFPTQNRRFVDTEKSDFIEASYAHYNLVSANSTGVLSEHKVNVGSINKTGMLPRTNDASTTISDAISLHSYIDSTPNMREASTFFDTPDGTRAIPAFLAMKGIRSKSLDLTNHPETRLQHLDHWTQMDFVRRLTVDLGEVKLQDGVDDIQSAAIEVVRLINQAAAKNGRTHARRPADQFLGESTKFDLSSPGPKGSAYGGEIDPAASHQHADFATTGSTHDPAPFWDIDKAFASHDRGSHMGYVRAHLGRVVEGGYSIVIHSTVPGAQGRNFCLWMDNSRGQTPYRPEYLVGHGGRFRNYWCQPDEMTGENMHPAPMPINRFGRPFAPITTLKEFLPPEEVNDLTQNNLHLGPDEAGNATQNSLANQDMVSGRNKNTLNLESFETKSPSSTLVDGLRIGTSAKARINFGGLTQAGIPGWCPEAGKWGFGRDMENKRYMKLYGHTIADQPMVGLSVKTGSANGYIPDIDMKNKAIGDTNLYGLKFVDHLGENHTIRLIYRQYGHRYANDMTTLPPTIEDEVLIHFDDTDVGQGGFTIGRHMVGEGEVCGQKVGGDQIKFKGNLWNNYPSPAVGVKVGTVLGSGVMTLTLDTPYHPAGSMSHGDILGYLGFPESGTFQLSMHGSGGSNHQGLTFSYENRTHNGKAGPHVFYGVVGGAADYADGNWYLSPRINFTSLLTDEVIAAAVEFALKMGDVSPDDIDATSFDCREMFAPDGKTLGEWGVGARAIRVIPGNTKKPPLSSLFEVSRAKDWGLLEGASSDAVSGTHTGGIDNGEIDLGTRLDVGYIPKTVLHISTKYRGTNANTATPVLVDNQNNIVDVTVWQRNLRGENFTDVAGDHIIPRVDSPMVKVDTVVAGTSVTLPAGQTLYLIGKPACLDANSWGEPFVVWWGDEEYATVRSIPGASSERSLGYSDDEGTTADFRSKASTDDILIRRGGYTNAKEICGIRRAGSKQSSPFLYFRGARDSPDHWVPLYFGGGFSGAVVDINDGTQNDYADFYTHPYAGGPTGSCGFQNVGEIAGSYALVDTNAMLAMFPGTAYLDQHKGEANPPFFNQDGLLPFDMTKGTNTHFTGMTYTDGSNSVHANMPSPIVLRFAHPHARYSATGATTDSTTYIIFGPGQAFPHNLGLFEPQGAQIVTLGNGYSSVPIHTAGGGDSFLPNQLGNGHAAHHSGLNAVSSEAAHLPFTTFFQLNNLAGFNYTMNWQPTKGFPNVKASATANYTQTFDEAFYYEGTNHATATNMSAHAHPFDYVAAGLGGTPTAGQIGTPLHPKTRKASMLWHMDGGYHPGGHFLDNHVMKNPPHPVAGPMVANAGVGGTAKQNVTAFRPCGLLAHSYTSAWGGPEEATGDENVVVVDATRVQNAEELGTILAASINTFPGKDPLKAIGGTFMPSMQNAHKQDRYGWVKFDFNNYTAHDAVTPAAATLTISGGPGLNNVPKYGWLRISDGIVSAYAPYMDHNGVNTFTLGSNPITTTTNLVNPVTGADTILHAGMPGIEVYVWSKAGVHRHNNSAAPGVRDHMCQVHFSGYIDAVDRTRPVGAVGWSGEPYSYLNSYETATFGPNTCPAGLGAWHPFLGFSPYGAAESCLSTNSPQTHAEGSLVLNADEHCVNGLSSRHLVAITHESELPLIAKCDRDNIIAMGDYMGAGTMDPSAVGTVAWDTDRIHNKSRYVGPATAGPHVEAQMHKLFNRPTLPADYPATGNAPSDAQWHRAIQAGDMVQATSCLHPTGDLFFDESVQKGSSLHESEALIVECMGVRDQDSYLNISASDVAYPHPGLFGFYNGRSAARNFSAEHVVWKRMDGGSLTMPAVNARGLGMVPWVKRKFGLSYKTVGEKMLGNVRFSFETTNAAMFPIIQAQELGHPQLAEQHPLEIRNALMIPNEDQQFKSLQVIDDTGQEHRIEGGSPLGTVIMDFRHISDREVEGLAPALAGAGVHPNLKIRLPEPDEIPGNIIIRSGFDRIQAYQNETIGSGGLQHPAQPVQNIRDMFDNKKAGPRLWPTWENNGWEHLSQDGTDVSLVKSKHRQKFPTSSNQGWEDHTDNAPLETAYEPHDRSLFFHVTRMGISMTHRYDVDELSFSAYDEVNNEIDVTTNPSVTPGISNVWKDNGEKSGGRWFLRVYDPTTDKGVIASYTNTATNKFTGVVVSPDFKAFISGKSGLKVVPSYYVPAGTTRMFAARRLRDHSEYSGASPDMKRIDWFDVFSNLPAIIDEVTIPSTVHAKITKPKMTPMPIPRMGHHYVTPTMALMPGHYAHPAYQRIYDLHHACRSANYEPLSNSLVGVKEGARKGIEATISSHESIRDPFMWFSTPTATYGPNDTHGGAFTLLTETKVKYEGYGIAASVGVAGTINSQGGHSLVLEAAASYTFNDHFPDPLEVGAYQIVIQPNVFKQQLQGFHLNHSDPVKAPSEAGVKVTELTGQQVNTVIAIEKDSATNGGYSLILAEAIMADVRGCEIIINEVMLDIEPDVGSQFTNLPPLALYNPLGVQETSSASFTRRSLPYRPGMFISSTPGRTVNIPWWGILHKDGATSAAAQKWRHLEWHKPDNYYEFCRASYGCIGAQLTLAGYPTHFLDIYEPHKRIRSLNPTCIVLAKNQGAGTITVDNNDLFPVVPYYGEKLEFEKDGERYTATYANRTGTLAHATLGASITFATVTADAIFWTKLAVGDVIKLSRPYDTHPADSVYTDSSTSITTRVLPQFAHGTRDTNSLHVPDAFLCMWHPNLGRPFTWYSDDASRAFYTKAGTADNPVDQKGYNHIPEHFETIHYHDFNYVASKGPFGLAMRWVAPPGGAALTPAGTPYAAGAIDADANLSHQGGTIGANKYNFAGFWPSGSHGGAGVSRLESYGNALIGWGSDTYGMDCETYQDSTGVATLSLPADRNRCFGYRMAVRQAYNRPRWSPYVRGWLEVASSNALLGYYHGPLIQHDEKTNGWVYAGADGGQSTVDFEAMYVGILERITQVSALLNQDQIGRQVRYSDGRRMTAPYGCAVRTIRNAATATRLYPGDDAGKGIEELGDAHRYYMVDWWGNTRGEDVRRFPVRGFGIRPSWDPEDAYTDTNVSHRPTAHDLFGGDGTDKYSGSDNIMNNDGTNMNIADWFNPASALRVGDRGDGRGCRWPTVFNESLLMAVSENHDATGLVLSHSTSEPAFGQGLVRPSNLTLQAGEIERGISDRLDLNSEEGLLKATANVGEATEIVNADNRGAEPVSRDDMRVGLDVDTLAELNDGESREYVVMSTEAASLHTDREVGQRTNMRGAYDIGNRTLKDLDMTALDWAGQPKSGVIRHSNAHANWTLGGTYVMEWSRYSGILDVKGWGKTGVSASSNPYQDANHDPIKQNINYSDSTIQFLYRPVQNLDYKHSQMFRSTISFVGPQADSNFYRASAGGKYGLFVSDVPSARTGTPSLPPYAPVYTIAPAGSVTVPDSQGPKIQGVDVTGYDKKDIRNPVTRMVMSENTLEHFRSDASRRTGIDDEGDYSVQPRHSQTLHPKGSKGDSDYNTGDHSGE